MKNFRIFFIVLLFCISVSASLYNQKPAPKQKPNIVLIYADDLGYGNISSYGGKIATPHVFGTGSKKKCTIVSKR